MTAEFGLPPWTLGLVTYAPLPRSATAGRRLLLAAFSSPDGSPGSSLGVVDADSSKLLASLECGVSASRGWTVRVAGSGDKGVTVVVAAGSPTKAQAVMMLKVGLVWVGLGLVCFGLGFC